MADKLFDLSGRVALVTGGAGGIGLGMAEGLARAGADIAIWDSNAQKREAARARLAATGRRVLALDCDVGDEAAVDAAFAETVAKLGRVDACFANAGIGDGPAGPRPFEEMTSTEWHRMTRVNLDGVFYTFKAAVRHMLERGGGGSLVGTSSIGALHLGSARVEHYAACKAGVIGMVRGLAAEYGRKGIRANAIMPGFVASDLTEKRLSDPRYKSTVESRIPLRRIGTGADFAGIAVYLMSSASGYHTGDSFVIDGGYTLG